MGATVSCPTYMKVGIDEFGNKDETNTDVCYPDTAYAYIQQCNNSQGKIEMIARVYQALTQSIRPDGWTNYSNQYTKTYQHDELDCTATDDELTCEAFITVRGARADTDNHGNEIQLQHDTHLRYICTYSLKDQVLDDDYTVSGQDIAGKRKANGELGYKLTTDLETVEIGDRVHVTIEPANPGLVYARTKWVVVTTDRSGKTSEKAILQGEDDEYCRNEFVDFTLDQGWGSRDNMEFSYTAFKWKTDKNIKDEETHKVEAKIELSFEPWLLDIPGSPGVCQFDPWVWFKYRNDGYYCSSSYGDCDARDPSGRTCCVLAQHRCHTSDYCETHYANVEGQNPKHVEFKDKRQPVLYGKYNMA